MSSSSAQTTTTRPSLLKSFTRSQLSSSFATGLDFLTMTALVELAAFWPVTATAFGALVGAATHFLLGRYWSFLAREGGFKSQAVKYTVVAGLGLLLNTYGMFFLTESFAMHYLTARVLISVLVGVFFNFPLHRHFVFR